MGEQLSKDLLQLDAFLLSDAVDDDAMLLSELDGFLAGVIVCPEMILPSEWMPLVWGADAPVFETGQQAQDIVGAIMRHYNDVSGQLHRGRYEPIYDVDIDDSALWEIWISGFWKALRLRPEVWLAFADDGDADLQQAISVLWRLGEFADRPDDFEPMDGDADLEKYAADLIPECAEILHHARLAHAGPPPGATARARPKVGRNDPCPCGSGKKFKHCCLK